MRFVFECSSDVDIAYGDDHSNKDFVKPLVHHSEAKLSAFDVRSGSSKPVHSQAQLSAMDAVPDQAYVLSIDSSMIYRCIFCAHSLHI